MPYFGSTLLSKEPYRKSLCTKIVGKHGKVPIHFQIRESVNPIALRAVKTLWGFCRSECKRVKDIVVVN